MKNAFLHLLRWDLRILHRNNIIVLSAVVALLYIGIFFLLRPLGNLTLILVVLVFNDPVVSGFMFAGVIMLFDKNQNTLQAVRVVPAPFSWYLLSKMIILTGLATLTALIMALAAVGWQFNYGHLVAGVAGTAVFFVFLGFLCAIYARTFNHFLVLTIGVMIGMAIAFLDLFGVGQPAYYLLLPSYAGLKLIQAAFEPVPGWLLLYGYGYLALSTAVLWRVLLRTANQKLL